MGDVMNDVRAIWRGWRRHPVIQVACVLLLTLGIGGNAVVFAAIESLLISPLAVDRPSSLVSFGRLSYPNYRSFAQRLDGVEGVAAFANASMMRTDGVPESIRMAFVSANYFAVLGVAPIRGRAFDWDSDPAEAIRERDALISERFWRVAYAADPAVMGRTLRLNDVAVTVVGVVPAGFRGTTLDHVPDVWVPLSLRSELNPELAGLRQDRVVPSVTTFARRSEDTSASRLRSEVGRLVNALIDEYPRENDHRAVRDIGVLPLVRTAFDPERRGAIGRGLVLLQLAVGAVFFICMANVTMLKLATVESQRCEFAVRLMHGARWWRIARGQMVEQAMLGGAAAVCAVGVAQVAGVGLGRFGVAPLLDTGRWTISLAGGLAFVAAVAVGWLATVRVRAMESSGGLQAIAGGRGATASPRLMYGFLTVQVALSVALVCGALVLVQHLQSRLRLDHGFEPDKVLSVRIPLRQAGYTATNAGVVRRALMREIGALPGVGRAGWARSVPFDGVTLLHEVEAEGGEGESRLVIANFVDRGFFAAMTIPVLRGREFSEDERWRGEVVVSQRLAAMLWPGGVGVGERLRAAHDGRTFEVVGVVGNTRYRNPGEGMEPVVYFAPDDALSTGYVLVKTDVPAWSMIGAVRARIREVDPRVATHDVRSMGAFIDAVLGQERQAAVGVGGFGVIGLVLVGAGLYAATARMVALRRREIGVRVALGARPGDVWRRLLGDGGMVLGAGAAGGVGVAMGALRIVGTRVAGLDVMDVASGAGVAVGIVALVGFVAILLPVRRAAGVDPAVVLRAE